jgi:hypothetical protein
MTAFWVIFCAPLPPASAGVLVHDLVVIRGEETRIAVETRGRFFSVGGILVELSVNDKPVGTALSGGDGRAFREFTPLKRGIHRIGARAGEDRGTGIMLCLGQGDSIVVVSAEEGLFEGILPRAPRPGALGALDMLSGTFPVVLVQTGPLPYRYLKSWLAEHGFDSFPVIPWAEGKAFRELNGRGIRIRAVVGTAAVIESAREYKTEAFAFGEAEGAQGVSDWEEIVKGLSGK